MLVMPERASSSPVNTLTASGVLCSDVLPCRVAVTNTSAICDKSPDSALTDCAAICAGKTPTALDPSAAQTSAFCESRDLFILVCIPPPRFIADASIRSGTVHVPRGHALGQRRPSIQILQRRTALIIADHLLGIENDSHEILGIVPIEKGVGRIDGREYIHLQFHLVAIRIPVIQGNSRAMIDGPVRLDLRTLQSLICRQQGAQISV